MEGGGAGLRKRGERTFRAFPKGRLDHQGQLQRWEVAGSKEKQSIKLPRTWRRWGGGGLPINTESGKGACLGKTGDDSVWGSCFGSRFTGSWNLKLWRSRNRLVYR